MISEVLPEMNCMTIIADTYIHTYIRIYTYILYTYVHTSLQAYVPWGCQWRPRDKWSVSVCVCVCVCTSLKHACLPQSAITFKRFKMVKVYTAHATAKINVVQCTYACMCTYVHVWGPTGLPDRQKHSARGLLRCCSTRGHTCKTGLERVNNSTSQASLLPKLYLGTRQTKQVTHPSLVCPFRRSSGRQSPTESTANYPN